MISQTFVFLNFVNLIIARVARGGRSILDLSVENGFQLEKSSLLVKQFSDYSMSSRQRLYYAQRHVRHHS